MNIFNFPSQFIDPEITAAVFSEQVCINQLIIFNINDLLSKLAEKINKKF